MAKTMPQDVNQLGQPIGFALESWKPPPVPPREPMVGRFCRVELLDPDRHAVDLFHANSLDIEGRNWTYLSYGPFAQFRDYVAWMKEVCAGSDPLFHAIIDTATGKAVGVATFMRMTPASGSIEVRSCNDRPPARRPCT
jgi:hypothetical protein